MQRNLEEKWLEQLAEDDKKAYEMIFKAYYQSVYASALRITKDGNSAKDACQEVFLELWKNRKKIVFEKAKSWLFTCAHNALINLIKKNSRITYQANTVSSDTAVCHSREFEMKELIDKSLSKLPPIQKSILTLSFSIG